MEYSKLYFLKSNFINNIPIPFFEWLDSDIGITNIYSKSRDKCLTFSDSILVNDKISFLLLEIKTYEIYGYRTKQTVFGGLITSKEKSGYFYFLEKDFVNNFYRPLDSK